MAASDVAERFTPVTALRLQSRTTLSEHLNPTKVIPSPGGLPRDWRGLADLCDVPAPGPGTAGEKDATDTILTAWQKKHPTTASVERLCQFLEQLDRYDILDDLEACITDDVQRYWDRLNNDNQVQPFSSSSSPYDSILTIDDTQRISLGLPPQNYHAFVLFADEDREFGIQIVETLETDYNLKICYKDRDLVGGINFEHEAIVRLVSERCNHLVVILSDNFFRSNPVNKFYTNFAQALGIEQKRRKVVPCIYNCDPQLLPPELRYYYMLNCRNENFFTILNRSIGGATTLALASGRKSRRVRLS
ncbi:myeloid differentiation primary response protein MyD88 [Nilaparvata lugens]|uniref:myeloid differentiation primary response protein MyD88 n=1 Tax=Nilaparvata lugens TaxID=108931 RepID=UPI00193D6F46|nr:myeloid differentiation primary response protein MyD88 [Nilaparvata lugens]XP_039284702.1 myeloid differentiation primary response protein MyD88 [Nilaparvata lugens]